MAAGGLKHFSGEVVEEKFLTCSICLEKFKTPKLLPCIHTFCLKCLKEHVERSARNGSFPCPNCRQPTDVPTNIDTGFKTNFFMNSLLDFFADIGAGHTCSFCLSTGKTEKAVSKCIDCSDYLCEKCTGVHGMTRQTVKHKVISIDQLVRSGVDEETSAKAGFPCSEHPEENVRYYCTVCEKPVCRDCKILDHHQHQCIAFQEAAKERKPKMKESVSFLKDHLISAESLKVSAEEDMEKGKKFSERYVREIEGIYTESIKYLTSLKTQTINQINEHNATFLKQMTSSVDEADMRCTQIKSFQEYLTNVLNVGTDVEILETYSLARKQNLCRKQTQSVRQTDSSFFSQILESQERKEIFTFEERLAKNTRPKLSTFTFTICKILSNFMIALVQYMDTKDKAVMKNIYNVSDNPFLIRGGYLHSGLR
ncbi:E3 ubiquitin-protein ligase TRIM56-like [Liolophura sinensis]|uniref:E3 ubiquitin-protein ligase TRIM56-like n=1 Tax=Liolophura sinensis TaxID=3198878 RepID=UPI00315811C1